jgi:hypothetical protein
MFDQLSAEKLASLIKGVTPTTPTTTKQNVDPAVYYVYSRVKKEATNELIVRGFYNYERKVVQALHINGPLPKQS